MIRWAAGRVQTLGQPGALSSIRSLCLLSIFYQECGGVRYPALMVAQIQCRFVTPQTYILLFHPAGDPMAKVLIIIVAALNYPPLSLQVDCMCVV